MKTIRFRQYLSFAIAVVFDSSSCLRATDGETTRTDFSRCGVRCRHLATGNSSSKAVPCRRVAGRILEEPAQSGTPAARDASGHDGGDAAAASNKVPTGMRHVAIEQSSGDIGIDVSVPSSGNRDGGSAQTQWPVARQKMHHLVVVVPCRAACSAAALSRLWSSYPCVPKQRGFRSLADSRTAS
jgi:hypothetical protein